MRMYAVVAAVLVLGVGAAIGVLWRSSSDDTAFAGASVVLLARNGLPADRLPAVSATDAQLPVGRVTDFGALKSALDPGIAGILIEKESADNVDWAWLQDRFKEGRLIGGINMNMSELLLRLSPASDDIAGNDGIGWTTTSIGYGADRRFYSFIVSAPDPNGCLSGTTDYFDLGMAPEVLTGRLSNMLTCVPGNLPEAVK